MKNSILELTNKHRYFLCQKRIRFGKGINGLVGVIINELGRDPMNGDVYIFVSQDCKMIKLLNYQDYAFTLYTRKIYHGKFVRPKKEDENGALHLDWARFRRLVRGYGVIEK